jgi:alpha-D-xyloside xylohydrolase
MRWSSLGVIAWLVLACGAEAPPLGQVELRAGKSRLVLDAARATLQLHADDALVAPTEPRARFDLRQWRVGRLPAWDDQRNHDPTLLEQQPPDGLTWSQVSAARLDAHSATSVRWTLDTRAPDGQPGPAYQLDCRVGQPVGFDCQLQPTDATLREPKKAAQPVVYVDLGASVDAQEGFYGLGEFFDTPQHRGKRRTMQLAVDLELDGTSNEAHVRVPFLLGTRGWGWFVESRRPMLWDVAHTAADRVGVITHDASVRFRLFAARTPESVVGDYTRVTGAPALPAPWTLGNLIWRNENKDAAEVADDVAQLRQHHLAVSGLWLDRPYDVAVNDFGFDPKKFPDPAAMVANLHANGLRLGAWSTPYLDPGKSGPRAKHRDLAEQSGWFVQVPPAAGSLLKWGAPIDFTHPAADAFWRKQIGQAAAAGIEGWKLDYGEDIVTGIGTGRTAFGFADGSDERTMHRGYVLGYHAAYASQLPAEGGWLLCRNAAWGSQVYASIIWPGDLCANWAPHGACTADGVCHAGGLPASVAATISLPTSGFPLFAPDTGGYRHGKAGKALFLRWLGHAALNGVLQIGGGVHHNPWDFQTIDDNPYSQGAFDAETLAISKSLLELHIRLFPYLWREVLRAHEHQGLGPVRALGLAYPQLAGDPGLRAHEADEHLLGEHLLVAPVLTESGARSVWLPPGRWRHWWSHDAVGLPNQATVIQVTAPLAEPPLYVREGAVLPLLRQGVDTLAPATAAGVDSFANQAGPLTWLVVPGPPSSRGETADGAQLTVTQQGPQLSLQAKAGTTFAGPVAIELWLPTAPTVVAGAIDGKWSWQEGVLRFQMSTTASVTRAP